MIRRAELDNYRKVRATYGACWDEKEGNRGDSHEKRDPKEGSEKAFLKNIILLSLK